MSFKGNNQRNGLRAIGYMSFLLVTACSSTSNLYTQVEVSTVKAYPSDVNQAKNYIYQPKNKE